MPGKLQGLAAAVLMALSGIACAGTLLQAVSLSRHGGVTRLTLHLSRPVAFSDFALGHPPRAVVDLKNTHEQSAVPRLSGPALKDIRLAHHANGTLRLVADLRPGSRFLGVRKAGPRRLVMRIAGGAGDARTAAAENAGTTGKAAHAARPRPQPASFRAVPQSGPVVVVIDPGHGGRDPGTHGPHGLREKTVTLSIARMVYRKLLRTPHVKAILTRHGDYYVSLPRRVEIAQAHHANVFISIHENSFRADRDVRGGTCYVLSRHGASDAEAAQLARMENAADPQVAGVHFARHNHTLNAVLTDLFQTASINAADNLARGIIAQFARVEPVYDGKVQRANFAVLRDPMIPSVLCETAFLSNPRQARRLHHRHFREELATAIYRGLMHYLHTYAPMRIEPAHPQRYVAQRGDTLSGVASAHHTSVHKLVAMNDLQQRRLRVGETLRVPAAAHAPRAAPGDRLTAYVVRRGDTLSGLAQRYHWSTRRLAAVNHLSSRRLRVGQVLKVPALRDAGAHLGRYRVAHGDTLSGIAARHHATVRQLEALNHLRSPRIRAGELLEVPQRRRVMARYVVQRGDTLSEIAAAHGLSTEKLMSVNGLQGANIRVGEVLHVPSDDKPS